MLKNEIKKGGKTMAIIDLLDDIEVVISRTRNDVIKFDDGNNAAGARVRKAMQNIKAIVQEVRLTISEIKNERKGG